MTATIHLGDCREIIATLPDCSIDSIVTDPPYELGFMGKKWDTSGIAYDLELWTECLRVLKPGGHLLAFGGTRTYHRMACAIEDAGIEIRDSIHWLYGSGFPKSLDVSKAIDKAAGAEREVVGVGAAACEWIERGEPCPGHGDDNGRYGETVHAPATAPATDAARQWSGYGTALKPAHEPIVVARKPLVGTVAANVQQHGTGALNIDGARVGTDDSLPVAGGDHVTTNRVFGKGLGVSSGRSAMLGGRWPANVITDGSIDAEWVRYFYVAKPSKRERNAGLDKLPQMLGGSFEGGNDKRKGDKPQMTLRANHHPTVKPLALMRYLVRLVTPPGGIVLEPFAGSGTTLAAAVLEGFNAIGCELTEDYLPIIEGRIAWAEEQIKPDPESLFNQ
jgi:site-specific DNA-methyltransferase (adenine-specific)